MTEETQPATPSNPAIGMYEQGQFIPSGMQITPEAAQLLCDRALRRCDELMSEMGLDVAGQTVPGSWMEHRERNQAQYDNDFEWRKQVLGGIFNFSNFSLNLCKRFARLLAAKTRDDLIGTEPFFGTMPTKHGDPTTAKEQEWYLQEKISESNAKRGLSDALKWAIVRDEAVVKPSFVSMSTQFIGAGIVAIGPFAIEVDAQQVVTAPGDPVLTPKGDYIYQKDDLFPDPDVQGLMRLVKEPSVAFRHSFRFANVPNLVQKLQGYEGLHVGTLDYRDFLCPLTADTIHTADINIHLYDVPHATLISKYGLFEVSQSYIAAPYLSGEKSPKEKQGENAATTTSEVLEIVNCAECYMRAPLEIGGPDVEIWMLIDRIAKRPIWYDYLGNHMGKRPFDVVVGIERVANRWYGNGIYTMLDQKQVYCDTQFNRVNFKSSKSSGVRFRNKDAVAQWKAGEQLVFGDDKIYDIINPQYDAKNPPLFQVNLHEIDENAMELLRLMMQAGSTEVGIIGPDDGAVSGLDTTQLATGIKSLERTGNVLMKEIESEHGASISAILDQCVDIVLENMDLTELIYHPDSGTLIELNREEIRKMRKTVKLLLTRSRSTETIESARMVVQLCREYYEALNPFERYKLRDEYIRQLKALETPDADTLLDEVTKAEADAYQEQAKQPPTIPPKTSIATKYPDLARSEQVQVLKREGIQPASDQEIAQTAATDANTEVAKAGGIADVQAQAKQDHPMPAKPATKPAPKK